MGSRKPRKCVAFLCSPSTRDFSMQKEGVGCKAHGGLLNLLWALSFPGAFSSVWLVEASSRPTGKFLPLTICCVPGVGGERGWELLSAWFSVAQLPNYLSSSLSKAESEGGNFYFTYYHRNFSRARGFKPWKSSFSDKKALGCWVFGTSEIGPLLLRVLSPGPEWVSVQQVYWLSAMEILLYLASAQWQSLLWIGFLSGSRSLLPYEAFFSVPPLPFLS